MILICTIVKDCAKFLSSFFDSIAEMEGEFDVLVSYVDSSDTSLDIIKEEKKKNRFNMEVYKSPKEENLRLFGVHASGEIWIDWKNYILNRPYTHILYIEPFILVSKDMIEKLLEVDAKIVAPYIECKDGGYSFNFYFRINNKVFHPRDPPGKNIDYPFEVSSVSNCFLLEVGLFNQVPRINPFPTLNICYFALSQKEKIAVYPKARARFLLEFSDLDPFYTWIGIREPEYMPSQEMVDSRASLNKIPLRKSIVDIQNEIKEFKLFEDVKT